MKAIVVKEFGGPEKLVFQEIDEPKVGPTDVLILVVAVSINPIDWKIRSGEMQAVMPVELPWVPGRDVAGVVRSVGAEVRGFELGDRVFALASRTYAELCVVAAKDVALIPKGLGAVAAAALPLVTLTVDQLARNGLKVQAGQTVLVAGAMGGVGRTAVRVAKDAGATVIAGVRKGQVEAAQGVGADSVVALDDAEAFDSIGLLDGVADAVGGKTAEKLMGKVRPGGVFATVLGAPKNAALHPTFHVEHVYCQPDAVRMGELAEMVRDGRLVIPVDRVIPLEQAAEGQRAAEHGGIGKVILTV